MVSAPVGRTSGSMRASMPGVRRSMPVWAIVLLSVGGAVALLVAVILGLIVGLSDHGPTKAQAVAECQRQIDAAPPPGLYTTYDPSTVQVSATSDDTFNVYGSVHASVQGYNDDRDLTYQCQGMRMSDAGTWTIAQKRLS